MNGQSFRAPGLAQQEKMQANIDNPGGAPGDVVGYSSTHVQGSEVWHLRDGRRVPVADMPDALK